MEKQKWINSENFLKRCLATYLYGLVGLLILYIGLAIVIFCFGILLSIFL